MLIYVSSQLTVSSISELRGVTGNNHTVLPVTLHKWTHPALSLQCWSTSASS